MSGPLTRSSASRTSGLPIPPSGWVVGSYVNYESAQKAVDHLADNQFPVQDVTIVGIDLMQVERVVGRLTWGKVLLGGVASGAWLGLFIGLVLGLFAEPGQMLPAVLTGVVIGAIFGVISAAASYAATRGRRDFASTSQLVANRYDVLCDPKTATKIRDELQRLALK